jgi:hypothetical protein
MYASDTTDTIPRCIFARIPLANVAADRQHTLEQRVARAAEAALAERKFVTAIDVFVGLGWLTPTRVDEWRQGRVDYLERVMTVNLSKLSTAMRLFRRWAQRSGLVPSETAYVARRRDRRSLRFSKSGNPDIERAYRTHWVSPELSASKRERLAERQSRPPELVVISPLKDWTCTECGGTGSLLMMEGPGPLCLRCADMDHLVFLAAGDAALTRRAKRASRLSAVVVRFSRARRRYERQGILVEAAALERAERDCLADEEARARRRAREDARREASDLKLQDEIAREIERLFPGCPAERAAAVARHTGTRGSGRVGRTAAGRALDPSAIELALRAAVRHEDTRYDELLMDGATRAQARERVRPEVKRTLERWRAPPPPAS